MTTFKKCVFGIKSSISGFTMPEILVVMFIITILFSILTPTYLGIVEKAKCVYSSVNYPDGSNCGVIIKDPSDDSLVSREMSVRGTFKKVPHESISWVYVRPSIDQQYYFTEIGDLNKIMKPIIGDRVWSCSGVRIGDDTDKGRSFEIGTLITQGLVTEDLRKTARADEGNRRPTLPEGYSGPSINVIRK